MGDLQKQFASILGGTVESRYDYADRTQPETYSDNSIIESADEAVSGDLENMRATSQSLYDNDPVARSGVNRQHLNAVGTGIDPQSRIDHKGLKISREEAGELESDVEREWGLFCHQIDYHNRLPWPMMLGQLFKSALVRGDAFANTPYKKTPSRVYGTTVQLFEADRVCNEDYGEDTARLCRGIFKDENGTPVAVQVLNHFPYEEYSLKSKASKWETLPIFSNRGVRRVMQLYDPTRIDETRGIPVLSPVVVPLSQHKNFKRNELLAGVINSMFVGFVRSDHPVEVDRAIPRSKGQPKAIGVGNSKTKQIAMNRGLLHYINSRENIDFADTKRPNNNADKFVHIIMRHIAAGLDMPLEELELYYQSSYSAARASILQAWKLYEYRRQWLGSMVLTPLWRIFWDEAVALGRISVRGYADPARRLMYQGVEWNGPARGAIKEIEAVKSSVFAIDNLLSTREREARRLYGNDSESVFNRLKYEQDVIDKHELRREDDERSSE